ncbi:MAG TPA: peptide ABC transporter substrate-binding protein [Dehalococcoidia bacterium]
MDSYWSKVLKRQASRRRVLIGAGAAGIAAIIAACGGGNNNSSSSKNNSSGGAVDTTKGAPADAAPPDQQVFHLRLTGEPKSLDPHRANFSTEISMVKQLFSSLFSYDENLAVIPDLASEMPTGENGGISKDGKTYTIKLRDASFTNGRKITATDVVYSMQRELDPNIAGPYASFYYSIAGAEEYNTALGTKAAPKTPSAADLDAMKAKVGVSAKDDKTVVYTLKAPTASFLQVLAIWGGMVVPKEVVEKGGDKWTEAGTLVGSGPFTLKEWAHNDHITLVANPNWHRGKSILQTLQVKMIEDDAATYAAYLAGDIDIDHAIPPANRKEIQSPTSPLNKDLLQKSELTAYALQFNNKEKPFDNPKVRAAFGTAVDRKAYIDGVLQGVGTPTTTWIPPGMPGNDPSVGKKYEVDGTKAKQLLSDAGFPNGQGMPKVTLMIRSSDTNRLVAQFLQDQFKKNLGVDIDVDYVDSATYQGRFTKSQFQFVLGGWGADWPYPDNWIDEQFGTGGSNNQFQYSNPKVDDLIKQVKAETDQKKQLDLYSQIQKIVIDDDAGIVPIYDRAVFMLVKPKVKNFFVTGLDGEIRGDYNFWRTYIAKA